MLLSLLDHTLTQKMTSDGGGRKILISCNWAFDFESQQYSGYLVHSVDICSTVEKRCNFHHISFCTSLNNLPVLKLTKSPICIIPFVCRKLGMVMTA